MHSRFKKVLLLVLAASLLFGVSQVQNSLNRDREKLGLTRVEPLDNAPPVLAFTTVALGGFRGLISNLLWIRANELQQEDKFFEMAQLADWITKLEPHFVQVWIFEEWNMAWNISVKFKDYADRWRWVQHGISLLRDEGLKYNPNALELYRELAWIYQNKIGAYTDDASLYYKQQWADDMAKVFGNKKPDLDELIHPKTADEKKRAELLEKKYKMDPQFMKKVDKEYGPLEWRLPEATAIYWAALGLQKAAQHPSKIKKKNIITLHRVIYQSLLLSFQRGRLEANPFTKTFRFGPNLDVIPALNRAYLQAMKDDPNMLTNIKDAHRNFLRQAVYTLYANNRIAEAEKWWKYLSKEYPNKSVLDNDPNAYPRTLTLAQYAVACVQEDLNDTSPDRMKAALEGLLTTAYTSLVLGDDNRAEGLRRLAYKAYQNYESKVSKGRRQAMQVGSFASINQDVIRQLLDPKHGLQPEARAVLRTKLRLPAESPATNAPPPAATSAGTNSAPTAATESVAQ